MRPQTPPTSPATRAGPPGLCAWTAELLRQVETGEGPSRRADGRENGDDPNGQGCTDKLGHCPLLFDFLRRSAQMRACLTGFAPRVAPVATPTLNGASQPEWGLSTHRCELAFRACLRCDNMLRD